MPPGLALPHVLILLAVLAAVAVVIAGAILAVWFATGQPDRWRAAEAEARAERAERDADGLV